MESASETSGTQPTSKKKKNLINLKKLCTKSDILGKSRKNMKYIFTPSICEFISFKISIGGLKLDYG